MHGAHGETTRGRRSTLVPVLNAVTMDAQAVAAQEATQLVAKRCLNAVDMEQPSARTAMGVVGVGVPRPCPEGPGVG